MTKPAPSPARPSRRRPPGRLSGGTRDNIIKLRLDDDELASLQAAAEARGYPVARHLRDLVIAESAGTDTATAQALGQTLLICNTCCATCARKSCASRPDMAISCSKLSISC